MMSVRRTIRVKAFQALFQLSNNYRSNSADAIKYALTYPLNKDGDDVSEIEAMKLILPVENVTDKMASENLAYLTDLVVGVKENQGFIDEQLEKQLKNWSLQRIEITNLLILRLATYELYFHEDINPSIVINEAIEITKSFNNENASKFVNGVLQGILDAKEAN